MSETFTLREAGIRLGVSGKALKRLIRSGVLPEAHKVSSSSGRSWVIPHEAIPVIAERQGWVIDLTGDEPFLDVDAETDDKVAADQDVANKDMETVVDPFNTATPEMPPSILVDPTMDFTQTSVENSYQKANLAPDYETIRIDRLNPSESVLNSSDSPPHVAGMADVYNLNAPLMGMQTTTNRSSNGHGPQPGFGSEQTRTEDPSPNDTQSPGAQKAMDKTPISADADQAPNQPQELRAANSPLAEDAPRAEIDLSAGTELATVEMGALIPHRTKHNSPPVPNNDSPSLADVLDVALLDRLLGAQEDKANAVAKSRQTEESLTSLNERNEQALSELEVVRREADLTSDRLREERMARIVADAKVAELRDRVIREMTLADSEKHARVEATTRNIQSERENANAFAIMGWLARRRYRRLNDTGHSFE